MFLARRHWLKWDTLFIVRGGLLSQRGAERAHREIRLIKPRMRVSHIDTIRFCRHTLSKGRVFFGLL